MDICIGGTQGNCGRITMDLNKSTPLTSDNFRALCTGERGYGNFPDHPLHYNTSLFHRVIPGFMAQGGDTTEFNGHGGESIYGDKFADENLTGKHDARGLLSMANSGPNTNSSQFFITFVPTPFLDGKHVVFGKVVDGLNMVDAMEAVGQPDGTPTQKITIE